MNERIKELIEQATTEDFDSFRYFDKQKFAELIAKECIGIINKNMPTCNCKEEYDNLYRRAGRFDAIEEIEKYFGM